MKTTGHYDELVKIIKERQRHSSQEFQGGESGLGRPSAKEDGHSLLAKSQTAPHNYHRKLPVKKAWTN